MIEFVEYTPNPLAPIIHVNRIGGIYRVGGLIKCTFCLAAPGAAGIEQVVERGSFLWEPADVTAASDQFRWAFSEWKNGTFTDRGTHGRGRTQ